MIQAIIKGNLGNQLFQYANAKAMSREWNEQLEICVDKKYCNQLINYKLEDVQIRDKLDINLKQLIIMNIFLAFRKIKSRNNPYKRKKIEMKWKDFLNKRGIYVNTYGYEKVIKSKTKNKIFLGYYESEKYFENIKKEIIEEFVPQCSKLKENEEMYIKMKETDSVAISIRRGDFVSKGIIMCKEDYFKRAINEIKKKIDKPTFFVFSDDLDWVKSNMEFPAETYFDKKENPIWERLRLMSECKNFILSNSSFSWWGCYLSKYEDKVVVGPKKWRKSDELFDIKQKSWMLIDN